MDSRRISGDGSKLSSIFMGPASLLFRSLTPSMPTPTAAPPFMTSLLSADRIATSDGSYRPAVIQDVYQVPFPVMESCISRGLMALIGGYLMGMFFGAAFAGFGTMSALEGGPAGYDPSKVTATQALKDGLKLMKDRGLSTGKSFAVVGGIYSTIECVLEKQRGKKDIKNAIVAGAATGALIAARGGPKAIIISGGGFATFSVVIELLMPNMFGGMH